MIHDIAVWSFGVIALAWLAKLRYEAVRPVSVFKERPSARKR